VDEHAVTLADVPEASEAVDGRETLDQEGGPLGEAPARRQRSDLVRRNDDLISESPKPCDAHHAIPDSEVLQRARGGLQDLWIFALPGRAAPRLGNLLHDTRELEARNPLPWESVVEPQASEYVGEVQTNGFDRHTNLPQPDFRSGVIHQL